MYNPTNWASPNRERPRTGTPTALLISTAALVAPAALASSLDVQPVRIELSGMEDTGAVTFSNQGHSKMLIQARPTTWSQTAGHSDFAATDELIVSPPVFNLKPGSEQVVRIGLRGTVDRRSERAYRIFFTELPAWRPAETASLQVHLSLAIPVFLAPGHRLQAPLEWSAKPVDGAVELLLRNPGNEHVQIKQIVLKEADSGRQVGASTTPGYVLAGQERRWTIEPEADSGAAAASTTWVVSAMTDRVPSVSDWPVRKD